MIRQGEILNVQGGGKSHGNESELSFKPSYGRLVLLKGDIGMFLIVRLINLGMGGATDLLSSLVTIEHSSGLFQRAVLCFNDI